MTARTQVGRLERTRFGYGFVRLEDGGEDLFIPPFAMGGAFHGDRVRAGYLDSGPQGDAHEVLEILERTKYGILGRFEGRGRNALLLPERPEYPREILLTLHGRARIPPRTRVLVRLQPTPPEPLVGTIEAVDGAMLTVRSRDNQTFYKIKVADNAVVRGLVRASPAEIKDNTFIGVSGLPQPDGSQKALEIHIFPEPMRGTGEGHQSWDLVPNSTMTNATVAQIVKAVDGHEVTVKYKGGEKKIVLLPQTRIVTFVPGDRSELRPGVKIFIAAARKKEDGTLEADSIAAGRDGLPPPM
jgi:hypothetical protein